VIGAGVAQRRQEIGIRMALGADRGAILRLIFRETLALTAAGLLLGLAGAWAAAHLLAGLLFGVAPADPLVYLIGSAVLTLVALAAAYLPAERASRLEPLAALGSGEDLSASDKLGR
jgi:ABC-type antimicrobial peptide transport system permease subunit